VRTTIEKPDIKRTRGHSEFFGNARNKLRVNSLDEPAYGGSRSCSRNIFPKIQIQRRMSQPFEAWLKVCFGKSTTAGRAGAQTNNETAPDSTTGREAFRSSEPT
jgi:hypothetical protein